MIFHDRSNLLRICVSFGKCIYVLITDDNKKVYYYSSFIEDPLYMYLAYCPSNIQYYMFAPYCLVSFCAISSEIRDQQLWYQCSFIYEITFSYVEYRVSRRYSYALSDDDCIHKYIYNIFCLNIYIKYLYIKDLIFFY